MRLKDKVAIITGAATGIGKGIWNGSQTKARLSQWITLENPMLRAKRKRPSRVLADARLRLRQTYLIPSKFKI